jgi:hemerythrin
MERVLGQLEGADKPGMSFFQWRGEYSVHHPAIDRQHQQLFRLADDLHGAMTRGAGRQVMGDTLNSLIDYTLTHFATKNRLWCDRSIRTMFSTRRSTMRSPDRWPR